ncbi:twin-arginine translocase TatA/TatE family subunit [Paradesulfitobacterium aromaticivorans]
MITFGFLSPTTMVIVLVIALIIFGPGKLPELGKAMGRGIKEFKTATDGEPEERMSASRLATRRVLESIRPGITVTLCSPLFFSWEEEARAFLEAYSVITVDGCPKRCTMRVRQMLTRKKVKSVVVSDLIGAELALKQPSERCV